MISNNSDSEDYSPAFMTRMAALFEGGFNQNILRYCEATCLFISERLLTQAKTKLCDPRRELSVSGLGGKVRIKGFTRIWIDLDQGVKVQHTRLPAYAVFVSIVGTW